MKWKRNDKVIEKPIVEYLESLFDEEMSKGNRLSVYVGTHSQKASKGSYKFATVIIIRKFKNEDNRLNGNGEGAMLLATTYYKDFKLRNKEAVNERMVFEVSKSIEVAYEIAPLLDLYDIPLEVHADINPNPIHESNKALQQAIGYILGMGYNFKVKPEAYAASYAADHKC